MFYLAESKQTLINLGIPEIIATLFHEKFGNKAPLFARWYKEYTAFRGDDPNWWRNISHGFNKPSIVEIVKLYEATKDYAEGKTTLDQYNAVRDRLDFASIDTTEDPEDILRGLKGFIAEDFFKEVFFSRNLVKDFMQGKVKNLAPYSKLPFAQASEKYEEKSVFLDRAPIKSYENGWRWIDVGAKCDLVGRKMKNCGSTGVMSMDKDRSMLTLFDANNNPHVVATYSPNEKRISGVEGQGSTTPKNEYIDYVIDVANVLGAQIDTNQIKSKMLKLKVLLQPTWIRQVEGKSDFNEFFEFQLPNGELYYSNSYEAVPKEETDSLVLSEPTTDLFDKLTTVFNHYKKDDILAGNPGFRYIKIQAIEPLKQFIKENIRSLLRELRLRVRL
jgi:hypothetical protein